MDFMARTGSLLGNKFEILSPLNHGSFGMVVKAKNILTGAHVGIKCLAKPSAGLGFSAGLNIDDRSEELKIHTLIRSQPNIVNLISSFETATHNCLVLEYCSMGDLYEAIRQDKGPKETEHVRTFMLQLVDAVQTLHQNGISHRDIKPENIFLTDSGDMKLGDFGLATLSPWSQEIAVGSDRYMAPEQFDPQGNGYCPAKADVWSIGICLLNVLFARNPFSEPAESDPLFQDFARDRQSLFDVFPNMSQDTFQVLVHCLAIDPQKRSLDMVRDALVGAVSFTIDDDSIDEFCTENRGDVPATANREPLRTPSFASPSVDHGQGFPWAQALHNSGRDYKRQLSAIPDNESLTESLFPGSDYSARDSFVGTESVESVVDSGLGISVGSNIAKSTESKVARSKPVPIAGSVPGFGGRASNALSSIFGRKKTLESKSWSDMCDEDEEERSELERRRKANLQRPKPTQLSQVDSESEGRSTPRACLAEIKNESVSNARPPSRGGFKAKRDGVSQHTGFVFEDHSPPPRYSPPSKRSFIDKWAALGEYRKGTGDNSSSPLRQARSTDNIRSRFSPSAWKRNMAKGPNRQGPPQKDHDIWQKKQWNLSTDWRTDTLLAQSSPLRPINASQFDGNEHASPFLVDHGYEWVGDRHDLHL